MKKLLLKNANVVLPDREVASSAVLVEDGRIESIGEGGADEVVDLNGVRKVLKKAANADLLEHPLFIPALAARLGRRRAHLVGLWCGALGLVSIRFIDDPQWLLLSMVGVGIAWASILSLPYAMLSQAVPARKMGIYMGIFNFFIVIPQILAASVLGIFVRVLFDGASIDALALGGVLLFLAGLATLRVDEQD